MGRMNIRATYAIDQETARRIKRLARAWDVSQAEVIRRSVERAADSESGDVLTPADVVAHYASEGPPRSLEQSRELVAAARRLRQEDDAHRTARH